MGRVLSLCFTDAPSDVDRLPFVQIEPRTLGPPGKSEMPVGTHIVVGQKGRICNTSELYRMYPA